MVEGDDHREAYTAIMRSGLLSRERYDIAEAEAVDVAESNMSSAAMRSRRCLRTSTYGTRSVSGPNASGGVKLMAI